MIYYNKSKFKTVNFHIDEDYSTSQWFLIDKKSFAVGFFKTKDQKEDEYDLIKKNIKRNDFKYKESSFIGVKCGYFVFDRYQRGWLTALYHHKDITDYLGCEAEVNKGFIDQFSYSAIQSFDYNYLVQAKLYNIPNLCRRNVELKRNNISCMPFDKNITEKDGFFACWETCSLFKQGELNVIKADIKSIVDYFTIHNIDCKFVEIPLLSGFNVPLN